MKSAIFITVRSKSTRLPNKCYMQIRNKPTIQYVIDSAKKSKLSDLIVLCTTKNEEDDHLCQLAKENDIEFFRGSEKDKLISLRGTLVPATTINRSIASIPLLGDLLIGKKVGDGVFGVSFKIKGPPKDLETTVNPIKTLTPRFITRTLEKIKKN